MDNAPITLYVIHLHNYITVISIGTAPEKKVGNHPAILRLNEKNVDHGLTTSTIFLDRLGMKRDKIFLYFFKKIYLGCFSICFKKWCSKVRCWEEKLNCEFFNRFKILQNIFLLKISVKEKNYLCGINQEKFQKSC